MTDPAPEIPYPLPIDYTVDDIDHTGWHNKAGWLLNRAVLRGAQAVYVEDFGTTGDGITDDRGAFAAAVAACPSGGILVLRPGKTYRLSSVVNIDHSVHVRGLGASVAADTGEAFAFSASDSSCAEVKGTGPGTAYVANRKFVSFNGSSSSPLTNVLARRITGKGLPAYGLYMNWVTGFGVTGCDFSDLGYAGIMALSAVNGSMNRNRVKHVVQDPTVALSYGISASDLVGTSAARSRNVTMAHNLVEDVPWEGMDTHGGLNVSIVNNIVNACGHGIALTVGADTRATAPQHCLVTGNIVDGSAVAVSNGIWIGGSPDTNPNGPLYASALIRNNDVSRNTVGVQIQAAYDKFDAANTDISNNLGGNDKLFPYTPVWTALTTNPTLGNGTLTGLYRLSGGECYFTITLTIGSTTNLGSGGYSLTVPVTPTGRRDTFAGTVRDVSVSTSAPIYGEIFGTTALTLRALSGNVFTNATSGAPVALTTGDVVTISGRYPTA